MRIRNLSGLALLSALAACAEQVPGAVAPAAPGFLAGLWHGFIFPVAGLRAGIMPEVEVYAVPNNGGWYDFGYFLGICVFGVGAHRGRKITRVIVRERTASGRVIEHEE